MHVRPIVLKRGSPNFSEYMTRWTPHWRCMPSLVRLTMGYPFACVPAHNQQSCGFEPVFWILFLKRLRLRTNSTPPSITETRSEEFLLNVIVVSLVLETV